MLAVVSILLTTLVLMIWIHSTYQESQEKYTPKMVAINSQLSPYVIEYRQTMIDNDIKLPWGELVRVKFGIALPYNTLGIAWGMNIDNITFVEINVNSWQALTHQQKRLVMFHELSHDVYNLKHFDVTLMNTPMPRNITKQKVDLWIKELVEYLK